MCLSELEVRDSEILTSRCNKISCADVPAAISPLPLGPDGSDSDPASVVVAENATNWDSGQHLDTDPIRTEGGLELARLGADVVSDDLCCRYGGALLAMPPADYYHRVCEMADRLSVADARIQPRCDTPCCPGPPSTPSATAT